MSGLRPAPIRRAVHFVFGACALLVPWLGRTGSAVLATAALLYNAILAPQFDLDRAYRRPGEGRWGGLTTYPLAVLLLVVFLPAHAAMGAWIVLAVLDPIAAAVGERWRRPPVPGNPRKSLSGSLAGFLAAAVCAGLALRAFGVQEAFGPAVAAALAGAVAEAAPLPGEDNLYVAGAAGAVFWWLL